jgi:hypothetical protein
MSNGRGVRRASGSIPQLSAPTRSWSGLLTSAARRGASVFKMRLCRGYLVPQSAPGAPYITGPQHDAEVAKYAAEVQLFARRAK